MLNATKLLRAAIFTPTRAGWGLPVLFWGKPGGGKTTQIKSVAADYDFPCEVLSPGERGEGAFGVTPMPDAEGYISYPAPRWTERFTKACGGIVFVDEFNLAPPAIQAPMLGLILDKRIGGAQMPARVRCVGAANDVQDAAGGWDLAPPLSNRLGHIPWEMPNETEWTEWLMSSVDEGAHVKEASDVVEKRVLANWSPAWSKVRGLVAGFIRANPAVLHKQPAAGSPDASKAWPSPRSWENACRAMASAQVHGLGEHDGDMFAAAFVGSGVIGELTEYRAKADLPDPVDVLDGKVAFKPDFKRLDRTYAVLSSTTSIVVTNIAEAGGHAKAKKDPKTMKRFTALIDLVGETMVGAIDLCWGPAKAISKTTMHDATDDSKKLMRRLLPMINAVDGK
jgi:hypothetical protein